MKRIAILLLLALPLALFAQDKTATPDKGVHFTHGLTWAQVQAKAKAQNKYIFMDCYTTWCGPCKYMSKSIFPQQVVGDAMNAKFISIKVQLDSTANDNAEVKSWKNTGKMIASKYEVIAYPTFLVFNPQGKLVHRIVGSANTGEEFAASIKNALNPDKQYYTLMDKYKAGKKDSAFLYKLTTAADAAYDKKNSAKFADEYLATQPNLYTKQNLELVGSLTQHSTDKGFKIMLDNPEKVDAVLGKGTAARTVVGIIQNEEIYPTLFNQQVQSAKDLVEPDWAPIEASIKEKYPVQASQAIAGAKVTFYQQKGDWEKFGPAVVEKMKLFGDNASPAELNQYAWSVFENCGDETCLQNALAWSKRSFEAQQDPAFMDTYANILYRLGKKDEAIEWEQKAVALVDEGSKPQYLETIEKMKRGDKTWN